MKKDQIRRIFFAVLFLCGGETLRMNDSMAFSLCNEYILIEDREVGVC